MSWIDNPMALPKGWLRLLKFLLVFYALAIAIMCFTPNQQIFEGMETPNIIYYGRLRLLLIPFNSFVGLKEVTSLFQLIWIFCQNLLNMFLLYPLILLVHILSSRWQTYRKSLLLAFLISLFIECNQLLLDLAINANRVFEIDDLWTNSLGGFFAFMTYLLISKNRIKRN